MDGQINNNRQIDGAFARIEMALGRIENVAKQQTSGSGDLTERHQNLREVVGQSIARLDALIAGNSHE